MDFGIQLGPVSSRLMLCESGADSLDVDLQCRGQESSNSRPFWLVFVSTAWHHSKPERVDAVCRLSEAGNCGMLIGERPSRSGMANLFDRGHDNPFVATCS